MLHRKPTEQKGVDILTATKLFKMYLDIKNKRQKSLSKEAILAHLILAKKPPLGISNEPYSQETPLASSWVS